MCGGKENSPKRLRSANSVLGICTTKSVKRLKSTAATSKKNKISSIPSDIVADILMRLPVRSLFRFRCVSKQWNSFTRERRFIHKHSQHIHRRGQSKADDLNVVNLLATEDSDYLNRSRCICKHRNSIAHERRFIVKRPQHRHSRTDDLNIIILFGTEDDSIPRRTREASLHYFAAGHHIFRMRGLEPDFYTCMSNSCNGLVCVYGGRNSYLVNPSIGEFVKLPKETPDCAANAEIETSIALWHDISTDKYMAVRVFRHKNGRAGCEILTLGSHSWRDIGDAPFELNCYAAPVVIGDSIHWQVQNFEMRSCCVEAVVSFDVKNETFDVINHPQGGAESNFITVLELEGYLCLLYCRPDCRPECNHRDLWILEDYGKRIWIQQSFDLNLMDNLSCRSEVMVRPLAIRDGTILWTDGRGRFDYYDPSSGCFDKPMRLTYGKATPYLESLISPKGIQQEGMDRGHPVLVKDKLKSQRSWRPLKIRVFKDSFLKKCSQGSHGKGWSR